MCVFCMFKLFCMVAVLCVLVNSEFILSEKQLVEKIIHHRNTKTGIEVEVQWVNQEESTWEPVSNFISKAPLRKYLYRYDVDLKNPITMGLWCLSNEDPPWFEVISAEEREMSRGIRILRDVVKGSYLLEYKGKFSKREEVEITNNPEYTFEVDHEGVIYSIDASEEDGTFGRLVNDAHPKSGKINSEMFPIVVKDSKRPLHVILIASRDIEAGEELFYFYGALEQSWYKSEKNQTSQPVKSDKELEKIVNHTISNSGLEIEIRWVNFENTTWEPDISLIAEEPLRQYLKTRDFSLKERGTLELWCNANEDPPHLEAILGDRREMGRGVKTLKDIEKGSFVVEYKGVFSLSKDIPTDHAEYVRDLHYRGISYSVDATKEDNTLGRLVNDAHPTSGKVNCVMKKVILFNSKQVIRLVLVATRNITSGEELFYFYGRDDQPWYNLKDNKSKDLEETVVSSESHENESDSVDARNPTSTSKDTKNIIEEL